MKQKMSRFLGYFNAALLFACLFSVTVWGQTTCPTCLPSGIELVVNGNFEQGNTGFSSSYSYLQGPANVMNEGYYTVISNPNNIHTGFNACPDHTSGTGQQMVINGATQTNVSLWCQTITVNPNTDYLFSTWVQSVNNQNPAQLQFSINGSNLGNVFSPPAVGCQWVQFFTVWNSGANTTASICIVNQNTSFGGNDFALDDISFIECVPILPLNAQVLQQNPNCADSNNGTAATVFSQPWNGVPPYHLLWSTGDTTATIDSLSPGNYYLLVTDSVNCKDSVPFTITAPPDFTIDLGPDIISCFGDSAVVKNLALNQPGNITYVWNIIGQSDYLITVDTTGTYILAGIIDQCIKRDTINVTISPNFEVNIGPPDTVICHGGPHLTLNAGNPGAHYLWSTGDTVYTINVDSAGLYWVAVTFDSICTKYDSIQVGETVCTSILYMPNVFTPDNDGANDQFFPLMSGIIQAIDIVIYNRWGILIFSSDDVNFKWDGNINGKPASDGVYYWILNYVDDKGASKKLTGTVTRLGNGQ